MTDHSETPATPEEPTQASTGETTSGAAPGAGDRIAKVISRAGLASRRDAEKMIVAGRVSVNGKIVTSPALDITPSDKVVVDGKPLEAPQETRLWLYYKPLGLVTTERDEQGRRTIYDEMPEGMPRVMNVGRLDLNSEGLLLLTNDGGLKRRLELPETAWLRKYRVRVNGRPNDETFAPLRRGVTIEGEEFLPMEISLDRQQGANAWLTVGLREGRNREIRRAMTEVNLTVNRLIRVSYGPFRLNDMQPGDVIEVKRKVLRDQLGDKLFTGVEGGRVALSERRIGRGDDEGPNARGSARGPRVTRRPARDDDKSPDRKSFGRQRDFAAGSDAPRKAYDKPFARAERPERDGEARRPYAPKPFGARRDEGEGKSYGAKPRFGASSGEGRATGYRSHRSDEAEGRPGAPRPYKGGGFKDRAPRDGGFKDRDAQDRPFKERSYKDRPRSDRPESDEPGRKPYGKPAGASYGRRAEGDAPNGGKGRDFKPRDGKPGYGAAPRGERPAREGYEARERKPYASGSAPRGQDKPAGGYSKRGPKPDFGARREGDAAQGGAFRSQGYKSHGGSGKPRAEGFKSHRSEANASSGDRFGSDRADRPARAPKPGYGKPGYGKPGSEGPRSTGGPRSEGPRNERPRTGSGPRSSSGADKPWGGPRNGPGGKPSGKPRSPRKS